MFVRCSMIYPIHQNRFQLSMFFLKLYILVFSQLYTLSLPLCCRCTDMLKIDKKTFLKWKTIAGAISWTSFCDRLASFKKFRWHYVCRNFQLCRHCQFFLLFCPHPNEPVLTIRKTQLHFSCAEIRLPVVPFHLA